MLGQFGEEGDERVRSELRAVKSGLRQAAESVGNLRGRDAPRFVERFAGDKLRQRGSGRKRRDASLRFETYSGNFPIGDTHSKPKSIAANGIRDVDGSGRVWQIAGVARIFEMVKNSRGIHEEKVYS